MVDYGGTPDETPDETPLEERAPISVSRDSFDDVLAAHDLVLDLHAAFPCGKDRTRLSAAPSHEGRRSRDGRS